MDIIKKTKNEKILYFLTTLFVLLITLSILIPVIWVFLASIKDKGEFYGSPWTLPKSVTWSNFTEAFKDAQMGKYFFNSIISYLE